MDRHEWPRNIKSARRKRRLVKTDRDKQLIQLYKRRQKLRQQHWQLPWVPLEQPYQRGWKRFFVLREDIKRSDKAEFYETLLAKINTIEYHPDKSFKQKKKRKSRYVFEVKKQQLKQFDLIDWHANKLKLSEREKECFNRLEIYDVKTRRIKPVFVFNEPWRYKLKVAANIITHKRFLDTEMVAEIARIDNRTTRLNLEPRISRLTRSRGNPWGRWYFGPAKYINKIKNIPRSSSTAAYLELET